MNPYRAYRDQTAPAWSRIDMLLAAVDGVIERLVAQFLAHLDHATLSRLT